MRTRRLEVEQRRLESPCFVHWGKEKHQTPGRAACLGHTGRLAAAFAHLVVARIAEADWGPLAREKGQQQARF